MTNISMAIPYRNKHKHCSYYLKRSQESREAFFVLELLMCLSFGKECFGFLAINPPLNMKLHEFQLLAT